MAQEFFINSEALERKVRQVFPSQGGRGAGFDLSASTQVVPIVDLTETAEGSVLRTDLQTAVSTSVSSAVADNTTATLINNTGFHKITSISTFYNGTGTAAVFADIYDGATGKIFFESDFISTSVKGQENIPYEYVVFLAAGQSVRLTSTAANVSIRAKTFQIADIEGNLTNPQGYT